MTHKKIIPIVTASLVFGVVFNSNIKHICPILEVNAAEESAYDYYSGISNSISGNDLKVALYNKIKGHQVYSYNTIEIQMAYTDRNWTLSPDKSVVNPYMRLLYADYNESNPQLWGTFHGKMEVEGQTYGINTDGGKDAVWNKEHIWAQSNGISSSSKSDLHHLLPSDKKLNNTRSSFDFGNVQSHGTGCVNVFGNATNNYLNGVFEPADEYKGDIARALMYMATRYYNGDGSGAKLSLVSTGESSPSGTMSHLEDLLAWNQIDPPDEFEITRNGLVQDLQHNRNPYIDHPEYACRVWGNHNDKTRSACANDVYERPAPTSITLNATDLTIAVFEKGQLSVRSVTPSDASKDVSWSSSDDTIATVSSFGVITGVKEGSCVITATSTRDSNIKATVNVKVNPPTQHDLESITFVSDKSSLKVGDVANITYAMSPTNAYPLPEISYVSSNEDIISVTDAGKVIALSAGNAYITITAKQNNVVKATQVINYVVENKPVESGKLVIDASKFKLSGSYGWQAWESDGVSGSAYIYGGNSASLQFNSGKEGKTLYNTTEMPGDIMSVKVVTTASKKWNLYVSDKAFSKVGSGNGLGEKTIGSDGDTWEVEDSGKRYFLIDYTDRNAAYISSIEITYGSIAEEPVENTLESIFISKMPTKTAYFVGESFDDTGLEVKARYSVDGDIILNKNQYKLSFGDGFALVAGVQNIGVSFTDNGVTKQASFAVIINEKQNDDPKPNDGDEEQEEKPKTMCGGNIVATSIVLSSIALIGICLLTFRKFKLYN